ncbi:MAG: hypothetical protein ACK5II_02870 [Paracoccus sp. (in: a-proteobacteria)]
MLQQLRATVFADHIADQAKARDKDVSKKDLEKAVAAPDEP